MNYSTIEYKKIDEKLYVYEHRSGLKAFVIPKKGYMKKYGTFATNYGSINNAFIAPGDSQVTHVTDGIAHFLEHKLFEQKDGSVMDKFSRLGSSPNAYTGFSQTVYLFSCTERFDENFNLLLNYVQNPYITEESVEKEKGIIGQEISMYEDDPGWRSFFNLLKALYNSHPIRIDIAGTIESIGKINRDTLYKCYNTFYHPANMIILVVGDVAPESVFELVDKNIQAAKTESGIQRIFPPERAGVNQNYVEQKLAVSMPMFQAGFKDDEFSSMGRDGLEREVAVKILLEIIMGKSSPLYNQLYDEGMINHTFDSEYMLDANFSFSTFGGESPDPLKVRERVSNEIQRLRRDGLDRSTYERIKNALHGKQLKQLNSVERISHSFISVYFRDVYMFDYFDVYDKITFEKVRELFESHFNPDKLALSVIKPV